MYEEDEFLQLSGIQHFAFCRRQWALIHVEVQWAENVRTAEGRIMHERAHDAGFDEKRGDILITRAMPVCSRELGVSGECDVVEFHRSLEGVPVFGMKEKYLPVPIEYKRGRPKEHNADALQLAAQAMCLEEMLCCDIPEGYLYYGETRHREKIIFDPELREDVKNMFAKMHQYYRRQYTPKVKITKSCNACSLKDICLPVLNRNPSVKSYIESRIHEKEDAE